MNHLMARRLHPYTHGYSDTSYGGKRLQPSHIHFQHTVLVFINELLQDFLCFVFPFCSILEQSLKCGTGNCFESVSAV